jgi:DNA repair protein SbcC/Rad50
MRPVRLDINGFASFREEAHVDFADADFFALVGPTGSGKSTVIDAMTFALYGSVPRWGRKGMVSLALAPTVARGTVKLVFEVDRQRYVVARELRRTGSAVNQRAASLERLADPSGLAAPGDETYPLAKDLDGVNDAVEKLLGLKYEDFTQCVVLPQGQFADFLHAKPGERQDILLRLLGAEHYRLMMMRANQRAAVAAQRSGTYGEELAGYADATPEAEAAARAAEAAVASLGERIDAALPQVSACRDELRAAADRLGRLRAEQAALSGLRVPDGVGRLDADLEAGRSATASLRAAELTAEGADGAARDELATAPRRAPLELARAHRAERARHQTAIGALAAGVTRLGDRAAQAAAAVDTAAAAADAARAARDDSARAAQSAAEQVTTLTAEHARLTSVRVPRGITELDQRRTAAAGAVTAADDALERADRAEAAAREARAAAPPAAALAQAARDLTDLRAVTADAARAAQAARQAAAARDAAEQAVSAAEEARRARHADLDQARRDHVVAGLRPHLVAGEPCPVCEQTVAAPPAPLPAHEVAAAERRLAEADRALTAAQATARQASTTAARADAALSAGAIRQAALATSVADAASGPLAAFPLPATRAVAAAYSDAPRADWFGGDDASLSEGSARAGATSAGPVYSAADKNRSGATGAAGSATVHQRRATSPGPHGAAAGTASGQQDANRQAGLSANDGALEISGADRSSPDDRLASALAEVAALASTREEAERLADQAARTAQHSRSAHRTALDRGAAVEAELSAARTALRAARDPLVELGVPAVDGIGLADGWAALARWAADQAASRSQALDQARQAASAAAAQARTRSAGFTEAEQAVARLRAAAKAATADDQRVRAELSQVTARITELDELLRQAPDDQQITERLARRDRLEAAAAEAEGALRAARAARAKGESALAALEGAERTAQSQLSAARDRVVALGAPVLSGRGLLDAWTDLVTWASEQAKTREQAAEAAAREADAARSQIAELTRELSAQLAGAGIDLAPDAVPDSAAAAVTGALAGAKASTRRIAERRARAAELAGKQRTAHEEQQVAHLLGNLLQARQFPQWLVSEALDDLVAAASQTLGDLSSGQFGLTHDKGDLYVIDHADAESRRSVRTLSGGETFQASLALALALSSQISALAAAGAARLDSIFLDEGFGTLDPETLEVVAATLEALAEGDRMVGVVTHVTALAERVPVRFRIARNARTSTITRDALAGDPELEQPGLEQPELEQPELGQEADQA